MRAGVVHLPSAKDTQRAAARQPQDPRHVPAATVLALQRMAGNRAVSGMLQRSPQAGLPPAAQAQRAAGGADVARGRVQRMVGFEAELSVNVFDDPEETDFDEMFKYRKMPEPMTAEEEEAQKKAVPESCPQRVINFLTQGLPYGGVILETEHFDLKADHNQASTPTRALLAALDEEGWAPNEAIQEGKGPTILEYASHPIDELKKDSTADFTRAIDAVLAHMTGVLAANPAKKASALAGTKAAIGIPVAELKHWLQDEYDALAKAGVQALQPWIGDRLAIQVTAGIIPSALPDLYEREAKRGKPADGEKYPGRIAYGLLTTEIDAGVNALFVDKTMTTDAFFRGLSETDRSALKGLVTLAYSYVVGDAWMQTRVKLGVDKNAVPFLLQMRWDTFRKEGWPPGLARIPEALVKDIGRFLAARPLANPQGWRDRKLGMETVGEEAKVPSFVFGQGGVEAFIADVLGDAPKIRFWKNELPGDKQPGPVQEASKEPVGIPLERRYVQIFPDEDKRHKRSDLRKVVMEFVEEARQLNTRNLTPQARKQLLDAADGKSASAPGPSVPPGTETKKP